MSAVKNKSEVIINPNILDREKVNINNINNVRWLEDNKCPPCTFPSPTLVKNEKTNKIA